LPFGVQCVPDAPCAGILSGARLRSPLPFGVQCVPDPYRGVYEPTKELCLHCLSAFSAFPTRPTRPLSQATRGLSPLPFGVQCVPDWSIYRLGGGGIDWSPLPFGVQCVPDPARPGYRLGQGPGLHCLSAFSAFPTGATDWPGRETRPEVSIAFRRSVRSRLRHE